MKSTNLIAGFAAVAVCAVSMSAPITANAQRSLDDASHHRQETKNNWRNAAIGSGGAAVLGLLTHNNTVAALGAAGSIYSLSRYEHDRKSQSKIDRARAARYGRSSYYDHGHRYVRKTISRNGERYYTYVRQ